MAHNKIFALMGLATKAGKVVSGEFSTENGIKDGKVKLVVVAKDASDNTKKLFKDKGAFYRVPVFEYGSKDELGHAIGKEMRASMGVTDAGFAKSLNGMLSALEETK